MAGIWSYPKDLAELVVAKLQGVQNPVVRTKALATLFETAFFASLKTEESQQILCALFCMDPDNPDPIPPPHIRPVRWRSFRLAAPLPLTVSNLVKLAKAADAETAGLAVFPNANGDWIIWGLIDQAIHWTKYAEHERPGAIPSGNIVSVTIDGAGDLSVRLDLTLLASLRQSVIVDRFFDVFERGPISAILNGHIEQHLNQVVQLCKTNGIVPGEVSDRWRETARGRWLSTLKRILLVAQSYKHGAALVLVTPDSLDAINFKHSLNYDRIPKALARARLDSLRSMAGQKKYLPSTSRVATSSFPREHSRASRV